MTHEERMEIARALARRILETHGEKVLAVFVTSSTAKALDQTHSDLELTAVVRDGVEVEDRSYIYQGILVEIEYPQESNALKHARRVTHNWPLEADGYRTRVVLLERDGWLSHLDRALADQPESAFPRGIGLSLTALIEYRDKLRNARLAGDELMVRACAFWLADCAARVVLFLHRRYMITTRWFFRQAFDCPELPPRFQEEVELLLGVRAAAPEELPAAAERLVDGLIVMARARGISVESDVLLV